VNQAFIAQLQQEPIRVVVEHNDLPLSAIGVVFAFLVLLSLLFGKY